MFGHLPLAILTLLGNFYDVMYEPEVGLSNKLNDVSEIFEAANGEEPTEYDEYDEEGVEGEDVKEPVLLENGEIKDDQCEDKNENCTWWAEIGECEKNPGYLLQNCPKSCNYCRATLPKSQRCLQDKNDPKWITSPGGLNTMFERIMTDPDIIRQYEPIALSRDPWVVQVENFVSQQESDNIFKMLEGKFEGSTVVGALDDNGNIGRQTLRTRTSENAWCNLDPCLKSAEHSSIQQRITQLTGAPDYTMEDMQVLHYQTGQFYHPHHDTITDQIPLMCGPRMLTAFVYFSDSDEGSGGATHFTQLGLKVYPKRGRMILWPSQKDADHRLVDHRTQHEAMNVTAGTKKAGNIWVHEFNYKKASYLGCAG